MRTCYDCKLEKPLEEFSISRSRKFGREYICKPCKHKCFTRWYQSTSGARYKIAYRQQRNENHKKSVLKYPDRDNARRLLRSAVQKGVIKRQPCEECQDVKSHGHHDNYSKPLDVRWLCVKHHRLVHFPCK